MAGGVTSPGKFCLLGFCGSVCGGTILFPHHFSSSFLTYLRNLYLLPLHPGDTQKVLFCVPPAIVAPCGKGQSVRWDSQVCCVLPMLLALRVVYLRSLFLIIIVHISAFHAAQREPAGGGSKSSFNFHCDGLLLHLKWCLICTRALRL